MSKYTTAQTEFRDKDCLMKALVDMGYTATQYHEQAVNLQGYQGDMRKEKAEIVIPRKTQGGLGSASNDLGFSKNEKGYFQAVISDYDQNYVGRDFMTRVKSGYAEHATKKAALIQGLRFVNKVAKAEGGFKLVFGEL